MGPRDGHNLAPSLGFKIFHGTGSRLGDKIKKEGFSLDMPGVSPSAPDPLLSKGVYASKKYVEAQHYALARQEEGHGEATILQGSLEGLNVKTDFSKSPHPSWELKKRALEAAQEGYDGAVLGDEVIIFDPRKASKAFGVSPSPGRLGFKMGAPTGAFPSGRLLRSTNAHGNPVYIRPTKLLESDVPPPVMESVERAAPVLGGGLPAPLKKGLPSRLGPVVVSPPLGSYTDLMSSEQMAIVEQAREEGRLDDMIRGLMKKRENAPLQLPAPTIGGGVRPEDVARTPAGSPLKTKEFQKFSQEPFPLAEREPSSLPFGRKLQGESNPAIDEVGRQRSPDPTAKDPFSQRARDSGPLEKKAFPPKKYKNERTGKLEYGNASTEEIILKGHLKPFMDERTRFVMESPEIVPLMRGFDKAKGGAARFSAMLRTFRGSDPTFVEKVINQMPQARRAWGWTLAKGSEQAPSKFAKNEKWLMTTDRFKSSDPAFKLAKKAHEFSMEAFRRGDVMAADLASSAVWSIQNDKLTTAAHQMKQAEMWSKGREQALQKVGESRLPGSLGLNKSPIGRDLRDRAWSDEPPFSFSKEWMETFNPRAEEWAGSRGGELVPVNDDDGRISRVASAAETRPGLARTDGFGKQSVDDLPEVQKEWVKPWGKGEKPPEWFLRKQKTPDDWFKVMRVNRDLENELVRRGMPANFVGSKKASTWARINDPELGALHDLFHQVKSGASIDELLLRTEPGKAADILDLLRDEGVPPSWADQWQDTGFRPGAADEKLARRASGGLNVSPGVEGWGERVVGRESAAQKASKYWLPAQKEAAAEARMISSWEEFAALGKKLLGKASRIL